MGQKVHKNETQEVCKPLTMSICCTIANINIYILLLTLSRRFILFWAGQKFWTHLLTSRVKMGGLLLHYSRYLGALGLDCCLKGRTLRSPLMEAEKAHYGHSKQWQAGL